MSTPQRDDAITEAARQYADARQAMAEAYERGGAKAVAERAYVPGGPSLEELTAKAEALFGGARQQAGSDTAA